VLDPAYKARIDDCIARLGLARNVRFYGYAEAPWDFYTAADIMVFASKMEGFGTVVIEAMAYGLPVVAWRLPGVNEMFIEHGRSGYLFNNPDLFRLQVSALAASPALRSRIGAAARSFVASRYDITVIAARYLALYGFPAAGAAS
jgi:glycosyltransferase involved in cell wall biosynthesis